MTFSMVRLRTCVKTKRSTSARVKPLFAQSARVTAGQPSSLIDGGYLSAMRTFVRPARTDSSVAGSTVPPEAMHQALA